MRVQTDGSIETTPAREPMEHMERTVLYKPAMQLPLADQARARTPIARPAGIPADVAHEILVGAAVLAEWRQRSPGFTAWAPAHPAPLRGPLPLPFKDALEPLGFCGWDAGEERLVFFHECGWCLKVGRDAACDRANQVELQYLERLGVVHREFFPETHALPGDILLQRLYPVDPARYVAFERETRGVISGIALALRVFDVRDVNVGWTEDDGFVFLDWAGARALETDECYDTWR